MAHQHHEQTEQMTLRLFITMMLNFFITATEVIGGIISGSLSLISDALHNFSDGIAIIISYVAIRLSGRPKSPHFTFGLKRAEILAAIINASTLIVICFFLFKEAYSRFTHPQAITGGLMIAVAGIGLAANIIGTLLLKGGAKGSMNIRSSYLHLFSDAISSVAVIIGGIAITLWNIYWIDPVLTVLISLYVLKESFLIVIEAGDVIMMGSPSEISLREIQKELESVAGVQNIHHVHLWRLNEQDTHFEAHVDVDDILVSEATQIGKEIEKRLKEKFHITHVTLQFEYKKCQSKAII